MKRKDLTRLRDHHSNVNVVAPDNDRLLLVSISPSMSFVQMPSRIMHGMEDVKKTPVKRERKRGRVNISKGIRYLVKGRKISLTALHGTYLFRCKYDGKRRGEKLRNLSR